MHITKNERSQSEKATYYMIPTKWPFAFSEKTMKRSVVARDWGEESMNK